MSYIFISKNTFFPGKPIMEILQKFFFSNTMIIQYNDKYADDCPKVILFPWFEHLWYQTVTLYKPLHFACLPQFALSFNNSNSRNINSNCTQSREKKSIHYNRLKAEKEEI